MELHTLKAIKIQNNSVSDWRNKLSIRDKFGCPSLLCLFIFIFLFCCLLLSLHSTVMSLLVFNASLTLSYLSAHCTLNCYTILILKKKVRSGELVRQQMYVNIYDKTKTNHIRGIIQCGRSPKIAPVQLLMFSSFRCKFVDIHGHLLLKQFMGRQRARIKQLSVNGRIKHELFLKYYSFHALLYTRWCERWGRYVLQDFYTNTKIYFFHVILII